MCYNIFKAILFKVFNFNWNNIQNKSYIIYFLKKFNWIVSKPAISITIQTFSNNQRPIEETSRDSVVKSLPRAIMNSWVASRVESRRVFSNLHLNVGFVELKLKLAGISKVQYKCTEQSFCKSDSVTLK